jgi:sugar/nucleoside kinase (ribokinase family)
MDIIVQVKDEDLQELNLTKGIMHLIDSSRQRELLDYFRDHQHVVELGGSAMNAIRTLAYLECQTLFTGMICNDHYGERIQSRMGDLGITSRLSFSNEPTGTCIILVTPDHERTMNTFLGASRLYGNKHIPHDDIAEAEVFHFSGYQWDTDSQKEAIYGAIKTAKSSGALISFDVADPFVVKHHREDFIKLIEEDADIVFANREEAKCLYHSSPEEAAGRIAQTGSTAVIKLGADGAMVQRGDHSFLVDPIETEVIDTTAAGDMFAAGFLYGLIKNQPLEKSGYFAALLASDVISRLGARVSAESILKIKHMAAE